MWFWVSSFGYQGEYSKAVDELFAKMLASENLLLRVGQYRTIAKFDGYTVEFWSANRWYAFANNGYAINPDGKTFRWNGKRPSKKHLYWFSKNLPEYVDELETQWT